MNSKNEEVEKSYEREELDQIIEPDKNLLDDEWIAQPKLFLHWGEKLADARAFVNDCKRDFDVLKTEFILTEAKIDLDIRSHPKNYPELPKGAVEKGKITEKMVTSTIIMQKEYRDGQKMLFKAQAKIDFAKHDVNVLEAVVKSLEQRKNSLENLVDLHGQKYFATPRASENSKEAMEQVEKQSVRRKGRKRG